MKGILEFELPMEQQEHQDAINGTAWKAAMEELDNNLRNICKHNPQKLKAEIIEAYGHARDLIRIVVMDRDLQLF